jgi:hypothetical protein
MGMFDHLICRYPLPRPEMQLCEFQTKSFECVLESYEITDRGQLVLRDGETQEAVPVAHTGEVLFYDFWPPREIDPNSPLVNFIASIKEGRVEFIREVNRTIRFGRKTGRNSAPLLPARCISL